ncbi:MAG TPA: DUF4340 domain-containing protein, partial [Myxococcota bacterium]|nr:DUF4340 domain-containing protein [Myxococcota bacterium]
PKFELADATAIEIKHAETTEPAPATAAPATAAPATAAPATGSSAAPATAAAGPKVLPAEELRLVKDGDAWTFEEPVGAPVDKAQVEQLVRTLSTAAAFDFADGKTFDEAGLSAPRAQITVWLGPAAGGEGADKRVLLVGTLNGDDYYVGTPASAQVFTMKKYVVERLLKRVKDFEPKAPPPLPPGVPGAPGSGAPGTAMPAPGMKSMVPPGMPPTAFSAVSPGVAVGPGMLPPAPLTPAPAPKPATPTPAPAPKPATAK